MATELQLDTVSKCPDEGHQPGQPFYKVNWVPETPRPVPLRTISDPLSGIIH